MYWMVKSSESECNTLANEDKPKNLEWFSVDRTLKGFQMSPAVIPAEEVNFRAGLDSTADSRSGGCSTD